MAYRATLGNTQLAIAARGMQTQVTLTNSSFGQQQTQSSSFTTGEWNGKPKLFDVRDSFILQINTSSGFHYLRIQQNGIATISNPPDLDGCSLVELEPIDDRDRQVVQPMPPMQPMQMGNMSMDLNSMSMQMGNMSMDLNQTKTAKQFCSQCGVEAKAGDRFCRSCGHELSK